MSSFYHQDVEDQENHFTGEMEIDAQDEDYGFLDEEIARFAIELSDKEPLNNIIENALKKKKLKTEE